MRFIPGDRAVPAAARPVNTDPSGSQARSPRGIARPTLPLPFELTALEPFIDRALLAAAARRADLLNVGGDEVVRAHDLLSPDAVAQALAARLGVRIDRLDDDRPPDSERVLEAISTGVMRRTARDGRHWITAAPRGAGIARLAVALRSNPRLMQSVRLASPERLAAYVRRVGATELAREAALGLYHRRPNFSAAPRASLALRAIACSLLGLTVAAGFSFPQTMLLAAELFLTPVFLAWIALRATACLLRLHEHPPLLATERDLPIYTIVVPLFREARIVPKLIAALRQLDYPPEKLDIKLVTEADDPDTRFAVARLRLGAPFDEIVAPLAGPRTKPKALAAALPFARGSFLVIYDAEDEPESDQLRKALAVFAGAPADLACVQARLTIDNVNDNWLTRLYAAEYAGLFDALLPALAEMRLPLPLGGTSNHFRTAILRRVGGWDPFNVTEDTDLGIRLARFGYRIAVIDSTTYEEAPARFGPWLRQRTRWFKGWIQSYLVHMRAPRSLLRKLGLGGFLAFQLVVGGTVLAALVHPFFLGLVALDAASGALFAPGEAATEALRKALELTTLAAGYLGSLLLGLVGLSRRKMLKIALSLAATPVSWLLLSLAAWRALFQFLFSPYKWEKTEHGLARTSWRRPQRTRVTSPPPPAAAAAVRMSRRSFVL